MDDRRLVDLLKNCPAEGLAHAIRMYGSTVKWISAKIIGMEKKEDIEECVSDTFVKLWKSMDRFDLDADSSLSSYINGIARHTALDFKRRNMHKGAPVSLESIPFESEELGIEVDFTDLIARKTNAAIVRETVDGLPPPDDAIFISRYFLGEPVKEIAEKLGIPAKMVENKLYRGKETLKRTLLERGIIL